MPRQNGTVYTYLATRKHPQCGLLLKVGTSIKPDQRCSSLGATRFGPLLPHESEGELKRLLHAYRVWTRSGDFRLDWSRWPQPMYTAMSEWHFANDDTRAILSTYLKRVTA